MPTEALNCKKKKKQHSHLMSCRKKYTDPLGAGHPKLCCTAALWKSSNRAIFLTFLLHLAWIVWPTVSRYHSFVFIVKINVCTVSPSQLNVTVRNADYISGGKNTIHIYVGMVLIFIQMASVSVHQHKVTTGSHGTSQTPWGCFTVAPAANLIEKKWKTLLAVFPSDGPVLVSLSAAKKG